MLFFIDSMSASNESIIFFKKSNWALFDNLLNFSTSDSISILSVSISFIVIFVLHIFINNYIYVLNNEDLFYYFFQHNLSLFFRLQ